MHSVILSLIFRSALILGAAELLRRVPRQTASARHRLLLLGFAFLALWPLLAGVLPELQIPLWPHWRPGLSGHRRTDRPPARADRSRSPFPKLALDHMAEWRLPGVRSNSRGLQQCPAAGPSRAASH